MSLNTFPEEWQSATTPTQLGQAAQFGHDSQLFVKFYNEKVYNHIESEKAGFKVFDDKEYVHIMRPGDRTWSVKRPVKQSDLRRFPLQYEAFKTGKTEKLGIPIAQWDIPGLSEGEISIFKAYGIEYVHQVAQMNEVQQQSLGVNAKYLVSRAKLEVQEQNAIQQNTELQAKLDEVSAKHRAEMQEMEERLLALMATKSAESAQKEVKEKKVKSGFLED
jgi:hypothetical protein